MPASRPPGASRISRKVIRRTVVVLETPALLRDLLAGYVSRIPGLVVCGSTGDPAEAVALCARLQPDLAIVEPIIPSALPDNVALAIKRCSPPTRVMILSDAIEPDWVREAVKADVAGFVEKSVDRLVLRTAIAEIAAGRHYFTPGVSHVLNELVRRIGRHAPGGAEQLSHRECNVLRELAHGLPSKEIASTLNLSVSAVENLRRRIMRKTGLHSIAALALHVLELGLIAGDHPALDAYLHHRPPSPAAANTP